VTPPQATAADLLDIKHFNDFLESVLDSLLIVDAEGMVINVNHAFEILTGFSKEEIVGDNIRRLMSVELLERFDQSPAKYLAAAAGKTREGSTRCKDGSNCAIEVSSSLFPCTQQTLYTLIFRDVSERKKIERLKNEFISAVSHELRTPLTSIHGSLGLIAGGVAGELPKQAQELIAIASNNCDRLVRLINDILDIEKIESGAIEMDFEITDLAQLVAESLESNKGFAERHAVRYRLGPVVDSAYAQLDRDRISRVMDNLLSNAAKFSNPGDEVLIEIERRNDLLRVKVTDNGDGIPVDFQDKVFERFSQADGSDTRRKGGTGLGLSICKSILNLHRGVIDFKSVPGEGSCFWFDLPAYQPTDSPDSGHREQASALICEDDPDIANLLSLMLKEKGIVADIALNAREALEKLACNHYRVMTLDLMLPDRDGLSLLDEIKIQRLADDMPVIVVSAVAAARRNKKTGAHLGITDWLSKPIDNDKLTEALKKALMDSDSSLHRVLHVEDDPDINLLIGKILGAEAQVDSACTLASARQLLAVNQYDVAILDIGLPDGSGLELVVEMAKSHPALLIIIFSAQAVSKTISDQVVSVLVKSQDDIESLVSEVAACLSEG